MNRGLHGIQVVAVTVLLIAFSPSSVSAVQGTCSYHGGIDCSAMADWDGSAVCNDGWRDSSETFTSAKKCLNQHYYCSTSEASELSKKYDLDSKNSKVTDTYNQLIQKISDVEVLKLYDPATDPQYAGRGITTGGLKPAYAKRDEEIRQGKIEILNLETLFEAVSSSYWSSWNQYLRDCWTLGDADYSKQMADIYAKYSSPQSHAVDQPPTQSAQPLSTPPSTGTQSSVPDLIEICMQKLGPHGIVAGQNKCGCVSGYVLNDQENYCVLPPIPAVQAKAPVTASAKSSNSEVQSSGSNSSNVATTTANETSTTTNGLPFITTPVDSAPQPSKPSLIQRFISWIFDFL